MPSPRRQKLAKRACDPCKIRKIKCSEASPCSGCVAAGIQCTFHRVPSIRGPRSLRAKTITRIAETTTVDKEDGACLTGLLDVYADRLFPIWPIVDAGLLRERVVRKDEEAVWLSRAVCLATMAQLKLASSWTPNISEIEASSRKDENPLTSLIISFFLHIYHENQTLGGGTKSLLYLRESITKAQLLRLDREASYASLSDEEQQLRRRILWLLFITERGVAMLHKLPVILKPNIVFPWGMVPDQGYVLPAFLRLVHLFWVFDQSGIFELLRNSDGGTGVDTSLARNCLQLLQHKLQDSTPEVLGSDVQKADMFVTKQWLRAVLWRAAMSFGVVVETGLHPVSVGRDFLSLVSQLPTSALESQGPTLEFKTFEIATAVVDATAADPLTDSGDVLAGLHGILSSSRGGNKMLLGLLNAKLASASPDLRILAQPWIRAGGESCLDHLDEYEDQLGDVAWPPLDLRGFLRSPSPLSKMIEMEAET